MKRFSENPKLIKALELLNEGKTRKEAAKIIGVTDRTLRRWLNSGEKITPHYILENPLIETIEAEKSGSEISYYRDKQSELNQKKYYQKLQDYSSEAEAISNRLIGLGNYLLLKILKSVQNLSEEDLSSIRSIEAAYRIASGALERGTLLKTDVLSVDQLLKKLDEVFGDFD